jgi:hypothetical protein
VSPIHVRDLVRRRPNPPGWVQTANAVLICVAIFVAFQTPGPAWARVLGVAVFVGVGAMLVRAAWLLRGG